MADPGVDRLLEWLDASFAARVAYEEDDAASELAFSFRQDRTLLRALVRAPCADVRLPDGGFAPVAEIGRDYVGGRVPGDVLIPLARACVAMGSDGKRADVRDRSLLEVLHGLARERAAVEVGAMGWTCSGRLVTAARDHLEIEGERRAYLVARDSVAAIWVRGQGRDRAP